MLARMPGPTEDGGVGRRRRRTGLRTTVLSRMGDRPRWESRSTSRSGTLRDMGNRACESRPSATTRHELRARTRDAPPQRPLTLSSGAHPAVVGGTDAVRTHQFHEAEATTSTTVTPTSNHQPAPPRPWLRQARRCHSQPVAPQRQQQRLCNRNRPSAHEHVSR